MVPAAPARDHGGISESTESSARPSPGPAAEPPRGSRRTGRGYRDDWHQVRWQAREWHHDHERSRSRRHQEHVHRILRLRGMRRSTEARVLAGVCGGVSEATGIDVTLVRIGAAVLGVAFGVPLLVYVVAWLIIPIDGDDGNIFSRAVTDRRGIRIFIASIPIMVMLQILVSVLHIGLIGIIGWPLFGSAGLAILIWRNAGPTEKAWIDHDLIPMLRADEEGASRWSLILRVFVGALLGAAAVTVLVFGHTTAAAIRPLGGALLVVAAFVVLFGPWWLRLVRDLMSERQARALAEERAQMAAHVHDSVLQTLALIQRSPNDPQQVVRLARAQERELRAWLFEGKAPGSIGEEATMLGQGIELLQRHVEAGHRITVHVVMVGDCPLTDGLRAELDAAKEATVNAAKWSGAAQVSLYAEVEADAVKVFVRDRGQGFDPDSVPGDRQGIAQSIHARMARYGGSVVIRTSPGNGAEVELSMPRP